MTKPTKAKLIQIRDESYREQTVECCGTCKYFWHSFSRNTIGQCAAVSSTQSHVRSIDVSYLGLCDLYEPRKDGAK